MMLNRNVLGAIAAIVIVIVLIGAAGVYFFVVPKSKAVTGLSYYDVPLTVQVNDETVEVEAFGNYDVTLTTDQPINYKVMDADGNVIIEKTYEAGRSAAVYVEILSPEAAEESNNACFIKADVTKIYYVKADAQVADDYLGEIEDLEVLSDQAVSSYIYDLGDFGTIGSRTVYPGRYSIDELPDEIDSDQSVTGIFPVTCESLGDEEALRDEIYIWRYFEEGGFDDYDFESLLDEDFSGELSDDISSDI